MVAAGGLITAGLTALGSVRRRRFEDLETSVKLLGETVTRLSSENQRLQTRADEAEQRANALSEKLEKAESEIESLRCIVQEREEQLEALQAALSAREVEIRQLRRDLNEAVSLRADRLARIAELEAKTEEQAAEIGKLRKQIEELKKHGTGELKLGRDN